MTGMNAHDMRALSDEELGSRITTWEEAFFRGRCNQSVGQLQNPNQLREMRRDIARGKTILKEKSRNAANEQ